MNLEILKEKAKPLPIEGGWSAILPLPPDTDEFGFVLQLLEQHDVQIQPGFFYDFETEGYTVLSLLTPEDVFREGLDRMIRAYSR